MGKISDKFNGNANRPKGNPSEPHKSWEQINRESAQRLFAHSPDDKSVPGQCDAPGCKKKTFGDNMYCSKHMNGNAMR